MAEPIKDPIKAETELQFYGFTLDQLKKQSKFFL